MRVGLWLFAIVLVLFILYPFRHFGAPTPQAMEPVLRSYLERRCTGRGAAEITRLDGIRAGTYSARLGGWPVYANYVETCYDYRNRTTFDGGHDADRGVAIALVRRIGFGRLKMYWPGYARAAGSKSRGGA